MSEAELRAPENLETPYVCEGGNLDCGSGLLLIIRKAMDQVPEGEVLEIRSTEISVSEDLPAWCRMTHNPYLGWRPAGDHNKFFVTRGSGPALSVDQEKEAVEKARSYRWQARTRWAGGMQATVYSRNHSWKVGQPASFDLKDEAPSAVEYVLGALGACLAQTFQIRASQQGLLIDELEISLSAQIDNIFVFLGTEQTGHSGFRLIEGTLYVQSEADPAALAVLWAHTLRVSPVANTLAHPAAIQIALRVI
jgi:TusA-related sulfurtransferase/uncharacterized OsmC-like protein